VKENRLLAEWFWTDRWMGSSGFLLPMEPRGLYREMLTQAWLRGGFLPNDQEAIRRAVGATEKEWSRCWPKVKRYWREDGDTLVNDTQVEVMTNARAASGRAREHAQKAARARHGKVPGDMPEHVPGQKEVMPEHMPGDKPPSLSPSLPTETDNGAMSISPPQASVPDYEPQGSSSNKGSVLSEDEQAEYKRAVLEAFRVKAGFSELRFVPPADFDQAGKWLDAGIPLRVVLRAIEETKRPPKEVRLLAYFGSSVKVEWERQQLAMSGTR
jgi:uncharacterized protein YdaU (DUF1376 family)